jgi:hypothetical protein
MNKQSAIEVIKERLTATKMRMTDQEIDALATKIMRAGEIRMALIGEAAIVAEEAGGNYSAVQHLRVIMGDAYQWLGPIEVPAPPLQHNAEVRGA